MQQGLLGCDSPLLVVAQHLFQQIKGLLARRVLVGLRHETSPRYLGVLSQILLEKARNRNVIGAHALDERACPQHLYYLQKLILVVSAPEERVLLQDHFSQSAPCRPNVQRIVVLGVLNQQLGALVESGCHAHVVGLVRDVKFGEAPVNQSKPFRLGIVHNVLRLHISMHYAV